MNEFSEELWFFWADFGIFSHVYFNLSRYFAYYYSLSCSSFSSDYTFLNFFALLEAIYACFALFNAILDVAIWAFNSSWCCSNYSYFSFISSYFSFICSYNFLNFSFYWVSYANLYTSFRTFALSCYGR